MARDDRIARKLTQEGAEQARAGKLRQAIRLYDQAIRVADHLPALMNRACAYYHLGDYERAVRDSSWALEVDQDSASMWLLRGMARERLGDAESATADLRRYLGFDVKNRYRKVAKRTLQRLRG